jgi:YD repeat-containing protein
MYTFDPLDRLTQVASGPNTTTFNYNGDGVRVAESIAASSTSYVQDLAAPLPLVLVETTAAQHTLYIYGLGLIARIQADGSRTTYHADALGSTPALTNTTSRLAWCGMPP